MAHAVQLESLSVEEYLRREQQAEVRHEYVSGVIHAMVGGSARHNLIAATLLSRLRAHLRGQPCRVFMSDMKVRIDDVFYYPDVMVACGPLDPAALFQTEPVLLVEVLSPSTEAKDRLEKFVAYRRLPSLQEYVLVSQDSVSVDVYRRVEAGWELVRFGEGDTVTLASVGYSVPIEALYEDVVDGV